VTPEPGPDEPGHPVRPRIIDALARAGRQLGRKGAHKYPVPAAAATWSGYE
jgi:hypothetical protein